MGTIIFLTIVVIFSIYSLIQSLKEDKHTSQRGVSNGCEEDITVEQMIADDYYFYSNDD